MNGLKLIESESVDIGWFKVANFEVEWLNSIKLSLN